MLDVAETFLSLQGESTFAGRKCYFIRLAKCNLDCSYCDSRYAQTAQSRRSVEELVSGAVNSGAKVVEVTGGEPLLQAEATKLCEQLLAGKLEVLVETNGSVNIDIAPRECVRIMDRKLPGSGMAQYHDADNYARLTSHDEVKFVVSSAADFDFAVAEIKKYQLDKIGCELLVSPVWGKIDFALLAELVKKSALPLRMQLQMHKIIWGDKPGV